MTPAEDEQTPAPRSEDERTEWESKVLYQQETSTKLMNERKYLSWVRVSLSLITLAFVVERVDLFLARSSQTMPQPQVHGVLFWAPLLIYALGSITIAIATWEFFADRKRIAKAQSPGSSLLAALIVMTLLTVVLIAVLLVAPSLGRAG